MRSSNSHDWSEQDWVDVENENVEKAIQFSSQQFVNAAIATLRDFFTSDRFADLNDLKRRIAEKPGTWVHGRDKAKCFMCDGEGTTRRLTPAAYDALQAEWNKTSDTPYVFDSAYFKLHDAYLAKESNLMPPETCRVCKGIGEHREMSMHLGFGMFIRNYLREHGFTDARLGMNLDDLYVGLVNRAVADVTPPQETP